MAQSYSVEYRDKEQLQNFLAEKRILNNDRLFLQVFFGSRDAEKIKEFQGIMRELLPDCHLIGCTAEYGIIQGKIEKCPVFISFTQFIHTKIETCLLEPGMEPFGRPSEDLKGLIVLAAGSGSRKENIGQLRKIVENREIKLAGGIAGGEEGALVFTKDRISENGMAIAGFFNPELRIRCYDNISWKEIGPIFAVTEAEGNRVLSINGINPAQYFEKYFSTYFTENLLEAGPEFPFLSLKSGGREYRYLVRLHDDGTATFNDAVSKNDKFTIVYPDIAKLVEQGREMTGEMADFAPEGLFVYCCKRRYHFLKRFTSEEVDNFQWLAPANGFLSRGELTDEYLRKGKIGSFTCVAFGFSEGERKPPEKRPPIRYSISSGMQSRIILTKLMEESKKDLLKLHHELDYSHQYFKSLFDNNSDIVFATDQKGNIVRFNRAFKEAFGDEQFIGKPAVLFVQPKDVGMVKRAFVRTMKGKEQTYQLELPVKSGEIQLFQILNIPIIVNGETAGIFVFARNITENKKYEEKILQLAYYDRSTGLPNREKITEMVKEAVEKRERFAVMFIDVDRFKIINDSFGHDIGDQVLVELARRLNSILPENGILARFGGDKFTILLKNETETKNIIRLAGAIKKITDRPIVFDSHEIYLSISMGVSFYPHDAKDHQLLLKYADIAMNRAKRMDGTKLMFFSNEMNDQIQKRFELESYLRRAIEKNELFLCYQPFIDLQTNRIIGCEALIRWNHPVIGTIPPMEFIPIAEETGIIHEIGRWVLNEACRAAKTWMDQGFGELIMAVNVSAQQIQHPHFLDYVNEALRRSGLDPKYLHLEITESVMLFNLEHTKKVFNSLQDLGVKMSIDDFGTGYSSLSYLRNLPINLLKIDRSFINNLHCDRFDRTLVQAIITIGTGLSMKIVAEGVETLEQIKVLKDLRCHYAQGYYIEKPLTEDKLLERLKKERR